MTRRDSAATKERILNVAIKQFADHGFTSTGVRKIAKLAGCDPALIGRYFGSKEGLYRTVLATVSDAMSIEALKGADRSAWPGILAETLLRPEAMTATMIYIRGVASPETAGIFQESIMESFVKPLAALIGEDGLRRARAVNAIAIGYATNALMTGAGDLRVSQKDVTRLIEDVLSDRF